MRYRKTTWLIPLLSALYWYSCENPHPAGHYNDKGNWVAEKTPRDEADARAAVCAWAFGMICLLGGLQVWSFMRSGEGGK